MLRPLCLAACGLLLPGCITVVDRDHQTRWVRGDTPEQRRVGISLESPDSTLAARQSR